MIEYLGEQPFELAVRPKRAAFLFRTGSKTQFVQAVEHASSRWGGIQEPILPVSAGGRIAVGWLELANLLEPDIVFDLSGLTSSGREKVAEGLHCDIVDISMESRHEFGAHALVVEHASRSVVAASSRHPAEAAATGLLPSWDEPQQWKDSGLEVETVPSSHVAAVRQIEGATIIEATGDQCGEVWGSSLSGGFALIWIADRSSLKDALWFWNIRAMMPRTFSPAHAALLSTTDAAHPKFSAALRKAIGGPRKWTTPDVVITSASVESPELANVVDLLGLQRHAGSQFSFHIGTQRPPDEPLTAVTGIDPRRHIFAPRGAGVSSIGVFAANRPKSIVRIPSPVRFKSQAGGHVRIRLSSVGQLLEVPSRASVARLYVQHGIWKYGGLEVETNPAGVYHVELNIPQPPEVLASALNETGVSFELSDAGRLARALGTPAAVSLFRDPIVHRVVAALTTLRSRHLVRELKSQFPDLSEDDIERLSGNFGPQLEQVVRSPDEVASHAGCSRPEAATCLEALAEEALAVRGLRVVCAACGLTTFVPLASAITVAQCSACQTPARFATMPTGELKICYRLNALLDRASDQGVLPHLFTQARLTIGSSIESLLYFGADLISSDGRQLGEVDVLGYSGRSIVCGEIKTSSAGFTVGELEKLVRMARLVKADEIILGCMEEVSVEVLDNLRRSKSSDQQLRVVDSVGERIIAESD